MAASIIKHFFLFVLGGMIGFASIAGAEEREAWSGERGASALRTPHSAIPLQVPFIRNQGQIADQKMLFYARTFGGTVFVTTEGELVYALPKAEEVRSQRSEVSASNAECRMQNVECSEDNLQSAIRNQQSAILLIRETLVDADLTMLPAGVERSGAVINSFIGNDPRRWQSNIPAFNGVQFGDVYEGISLEVRATGDNVEKIFTVAPGADPARIALRLAGVEDVRITPAGELEARTTLGPVRFTAPVAFQMGADGERQDVRVAYALEGGQIGFCVGAFDAARPLVIDPLLASTFIGGSSNNVVRAMALDNQTNVLVAGYTASTDFPTTNSPYQEVYGGAPYDGFIAKFDPQLTNLLAATYLGGAGEDAIMAIAVNTNNGAVYVAGYTASTNFPMQGAAYGTYRGGNYDAFVSALDSNLASLTASTYIGGTNVDKAYALALNSIGEPYIAGYTASTNFPTNNNYGATFQTNLIGSNDAFVITFNTALSATRASTFIGGNSNDQAFGISIDTNDFVYLAGVTASTNFPVTNGYQTARSGASDAFVTKLFGDLTNIVASTYLGGTSNEVAYGIAVAPYTNIVCVVGYTTSTNYPRNPTNNTIAPGYTNQLMGRKDAFLTRLDLGLTNILASTYLGGTGDDEATAVLASATTNSLRIYVAGWTDSTNFPVTANAYNTNANGGRDAFISYFGTGNTLQASTYLGGATNDSAYAIALQDQRGDLAFASLFVAGVTASTNFPTTRRAYDNDRAGQVNDDGFVTKLGFGLAYGTKKWQVTISDPGDDGAAWFGAPSLGWDGTIYVGGGSNLYAYDANGNERWRFRANGHITSHSGSYPGLGSTPAIAQDGTIYFGTLNGYLYAVSKDGAGIWTNNFSGQAFYSSPAIGNDGTIYLGSQIASESVFKFYAVSSNGTVKWTNDVVSQSFIGSPAIDTNGNIYVAANAYTSTVYVIDINGTSLTNWSIPSTISSSPLIGSNGWVYIGSGAGLYGFDTVGSASQTWATAEAICSSPAMDSNGVIYVGGGNNLYAFNTNGDTNHVWNTGGAIKSSPAIAEDGTIYAANIDNLYAFNSDGSTNWVSVMTDGLVDYQSPLLRRDGTIYFADDLNLYAIFGKSQTAQSAWPTYKHDVLRTGNAAFDAAEILTPTNLTASQGVYSNYVDVRWDGVANAEFYELYRGTTTNQGEASLFRTDLLSTNCVDTNVAPGMIYYYRVRVATPVTMSDFSDSCAGGVPPLPPTGVAASKGYRDPPPCYTNSIHITWNASSNATTYDLYHSLTNDTNTASRLATTTNVIGYTNERPAFVRGLTYYYWVQAGNGLAGTSGFSADYGVTNSGGTPPLAPADIQASINDYRWVFVEWSAATGATMYAVYRDTTTNIPADFMMVTNGTNYHDTNAEALTNYYYWVRSTNEYGLGEFSAMTNGWRLLYPPTNVVADGSFTNKIRVSWDTEPAATHYVIYRSISNDSATASNFPYEPSFTYYDDISTVRGADYYYWVRSKNARGTSVYSKVAHGGTVPYPPLNVSATDGTDETRVMVTWNAADYATGYEVFRLDAWTPWSLVNPLASVSGVTYPDTQACPGLRYYYWVKATNRFGCSGLSEFDTGYRPLATPGAISASDGVFTGYIHVTWSSSDNASNYELWRGTNLSLSAAQMLFNNWSTNNYYDTDAKPGVMFYYRVKAKTAQFVSDFSPCDSGYRALGEVDIGVSDLVFLPTRMDAGGAPDAVSFRVKNHGLRDMAAPNASVACVLYISSNAVFGADAESIGGITVDVPLAVNNSKVVVLSKDEREALAIPAAAPGWYYVFVNIEHAPPTLWLDPNLNNNTISRNGGRIKIGAGQPAGLLLVNDYNGDGYTDLAMYQESTGAWVVWFYGPNGDVTQGFTLSGYGGPGFKAAPGDYDGDGKTDFAVYQEAAPSTGSTSSPQAGSGQGGTWKIWFSAYNYAQALIEGYGGPGFEPVPGDYDGDGLADPAVYQASTGIWRVWLSGAGYAATELNLLQPTAYSLQPVPGDYDGDGKVDIALYQEQGGIWRIWRSSTQYVLVTQEGWGGAGYRPVAADYDCDGLMDPAVFHAATGTWRIWLSAGGYAEVNAPGWGNTGTVAVPGDYDGDGMADPAVYWDSFGMWRLWLSGAGYRQTDLLAWPGAGFQPVWNN